MIFLKWLKYQLRGGGGGYSRPPVASIGVSLDKSLASVREIHLFVSSLALGN